MSFSAIIQARMSSTRLPKKILLQYKKISPLDFLIKRLKKSKYLKDIIVATTKKKIDNKIVNFCKKKKIKYFRGDENNVLKRYYLAAKKNKVKNIVRITSDCPLVDYRIIDEMIKSFNKKIDYYANSYPLPCTYPDGMDIEIFTFNALEKTFKNAILPSETEHVTIYMWKSKKFKLKKKNLKKDISYLRFTIDYKNDFKLFCKLLDIFGKKKLINITMNELVEYVLKNPKIISYQKYIKRNQGWGKSYILDKKFLKNEKK
jgi:spore coat polysaccharide biosynthesis protein SpsF